MTTTDNLYTIRREINPGWTPCEWQEWSGLTEEQVTKFLEETTNDPAFHGHQVRVVGNGEEWTEHEWFYDHCDDSEYFDDRDEE